MTKKVKTASLREIYARCNDAIREFDAVIAKCNEDVREFDAMIALYDLQSTPATFQEGVGDSDEAFVDCPPSPSPSSSSSSCYSSA
jgi:hypothetical protein